MENLTIRQSNGKMVLANKKNDFIQLYCDLNMDLLSICDTLLSTVVSKMVDRIELRNNDKYVLTVYRSVTQYDAERILSILRTKGLDTKVILSY